MSETPRILVIGRVTLDALLSSGAYAESGSQILFPQYDLLPGGCAGIIAVTLACLGANVTLVGRIGSDVAGRMVCEMLEHRGVLVTHLKKDRHASTSFSVINVADDAEPAIQHCVGANGLLSAEDIPVSQFAEYRVVHIGGALLFPALDGAPMADILARARSVGATTSVSVTRNTERKALFEPVYPYVDLLFMNRREALNISATRTVQEAATWFLERGVRLSIITMGKEGALVSSKENTASVPPLPVAAVDSTGCGDTFTGAFIDAFARDLPPEKCARWANGVAAHCARKLGAIPTPFRIGEIRAMLAGYEAYGQTAALILAGGRSERMQGVPQKVAVELCGKSIIERTVEALRTAGVHRLIVVIGRHKDLVEQCLKDQPVEFVDVGEECFGTGQAVRMALNQVSQLPDSVLVVNGDTPLLESEGIARLIRERVQTGASVTMATAITPDFVLYGHAAVIRDQDGRFERIDHYTAAAQSGAVREINAGTYCFHRDALIAASRQLTPASDGDFHHSDILAILRNSGALVVPVLFSDFSQFISVNTLGHLQQAEEILGRRNANAGQETTANGQR